MHQRTRLHAFSVIPCLALGLLAQAPDSEIKARPAAADAQVVQIAAHASRWDYPKELTVPPNTQIHYVQKGDTLWDLGTKYLGNPFAWPQLWELNKWVKDPHWIYPGDPLLVDGSRATLPQGDGPELGREVADLQPDVRRAPRLSRDEYAFSIQDFIQMPFLVEPSLAGYLKTANALKVVGKKDGSKDLQADGDIVYLNGGANQGFKAGDRLVTLKLQAEQVFHPDDKRHRKAMGDIVQQSAILRITNALPNESIAIVERAMDSVLVGQSAIPFAEPVNLPANLRTDLADPIELPPAPAKIIYIRDGKLFGSTGDMAIIDHGSKSGLKVGDTFLAARSQQLDPSRKARSQDHTNVYVGQVVVVRTEEKTATCRILRSKTEIMLGDLISQ